MVDTGVSPLDGWRAFSHAELQREYSPSSCVPNGDLEPFIAAYTNDSASARAQVQATPGQFSEVRYGSATSQTIDVAVPARREDAVPLLVYIHGGYWQLLSKRESFFAASASLANGIAFAAVDYTLAPDASLDQIVAECRTAVALLRTDAARLGIDPGRIYVAGSSAGAHLAAMVALDRTTDWRPAGCGLVSGVFDLEPLMYINDAVGLDLASAVRNSPLRHDLAGFPPTVVAVGSNETNEFKRQSTALATALRSAGTAVDQFEVADRNHFDVILDLCDDDTMLGIAILGLIARSSA